MGLSANQVSSQHYIERLMIVGALIIRIVTMAHGAQGRDRHNHLFLRQENHLCLFPPALSVVLSLLSMAA